MQLKSIQAKITLWAGLCLAGALAPFVGYSVLAARDSAIANAEREAVVRARVEAVRVRAELEQALNVTRTVAQMLTTTKSTDKVPLSREGVNEIMKKVLAENPQFIAFYSNWEPNAYDGLDKKYGGQAGYNPDGRFNFIWSRDENGEIKSDVTPPGDEEVSDWYQAPKRALNEAIIEPYPYKVQGKEVLETTLSVPIIVKGKFVGMVGADIKIDFLQQMADEMDLYNRTGKLLLLSHKGVIAGATGAPEMINQPLPQHYPDLADDLVNIKDGREVVEIKGDKLKVLVPLLVGKTRTPWAAMILIPTTAITGDATALLLRQLLIGILLVALTLRLLWYLAGKLVTPIQVAARFADNIAQGRKVEKLPVTTQDETSHLLSAMNGMLESNSTLLQSREDRDRMQGSIMRLLDQVSSVAEGDLTREAEVAGDATGAIADSFNFMIAELRRIIGKVQVVAQEVSSSATTTQQSTQQLAEGAVTQAQQIIQTSRSLDTMAHSIRQISETAEASRNVAEKSLHAAKRGAEVVQNTINGLASLREQVQETSKRIKRLGENSQEIGEIVQLISDIAYRTSVLALNASIQAARAGDAGRGFAVVAEEVQQLSKRSTDAAKRITELVKTAKLGANEAIAAVEESTRGVVEGTNLIYEAGDALAEIELVSRQLAELVQSISQTTEQQAQDSEAVVRQMVKISQATQATASGIRQSASSVNQLAVLADDLQVSVASFKLSSPQTNGYVNGRHAGARYALN